MFIPGNLGGRGSSTKKSKVDTEKFGEISAIGKDSLLIEWALSNVKPDGASVHIKLQNKAYIFNDGRNELTLKPGTLLCGYGTGKFKLQTVIKMKDQTKPEVIDEDKCIKYVLEGPNTLLIYNNQLTTLDTLVKNQRKVNAHTYVFYINVATHI